jgi:hypothetical protein
LFDHKYVFYIMVSLYAGIYFPAYYVHIQRVYNKSVFFFSIIELSKLYHE